MDHSSTARLESSEQGATSLMPTSVQLKQVEAKPWRKACACLLVKEHDLWRGNNNNNDDNHKNNSNNNTVNNVAGGAAAAAAAACCGGSTRSLSSTYSWLPHVCDRAVVFGSACLATQRRSFDFCGMWVLTRSQQVTWFLKQTLGYLGKTFRCASTVKSALRSCRKLQAAVSK